MGSGSRRGEVGSLPSKAFKHPARMPADFMLLPGFKFPPKAQSLKSTVRYWQISSTYCRYGHRTCRNRRPRHRLYPGHRSDRKRIRAGPEALYWAAAIATSGSEARRKMAENKLGLGEKVQPT